MKTKMSKKTTVTVTILACLLAVAVATTIVLAAFSANKTATTTVRFNNGVQVKIIGAYVPDADPAQADVISRQATLMWACTPAGESLKNSEDVIEDISTDVTFQAISFENGDDTESTDAWFIARASIGADDNYTLSQDQLDAIDMVIDTAKWTAIGSTGWYAYTYSPPVGASSVSVAGQSITFGDVEPEDTVPFVTSASIAVANITAANANTNMLAGAKYKARVEIFAVNARAADAATVLTGIVSPSP